MEEITSVTPIHSLTAYDHLPLGDPAGLTPQASIPMNVCMCRTSGLCYDSRPRIFPPVANDPGNGRLLRVVTTRPSSWCLAVKPGIVCYRYQLSLALRSHTPNFSQSGTLMRLHESLAEGPRASQLDKSIFIQHLMMFDRLSASPWSPRGKGRRARCRAQAFPGPGHPRILDFPRPSDL
jgi:hypothetical protein